MQVNFKTVAELEGDTTSPERVALLETLIGQMNGNDLRIWAETSRMKFHISEAINAAENEAPND